MATAYDTNGFNWEQYKGKINTLVHDTSAKVRVIRDLFPLYGNRGETIVQNVEDHQVVAVPGHPLTIPTTQNLPPVTLACDFTIQPEQYADEDALNSLAVEAAYRVVAAEEAAILLGNEVGSFLESLNAVASPKDGSVGLSPVANKERR